MDINLLEALPVSKPPPESALRPASPSAETRRSDTLTFEQTLRARQKEEKQTQTQAEAAASQTAGAATQKPAVEDEHRPDQNPAPAAEAASDQPPARISGGFVTLLKDGVLLPAEGGLSAAAEGAAQAADGGVLQPLPVAGETTLTEGGIDFASALEQSLSQPAEEETLIQPQSTTEVKSEKPVTTETKLEGKAESPARTRSSGDAQTNQPVEAQVVMENPPPAHSPTAQAAMPLRGESVQVAGRSWVEMVRQIAGQMEASIQQGRSSLRLQLHPQELGGIDIRFASNSQGVHVTVYAEQASTGRLLESQLNQLRQSLTEAGVNLAQLNIHHESPSHQPQGGFHGHNPRSRSFGGREIEQGNGLLMEQAERWRNLSVSGVDYRI